MRTHGLGFRLFQGFRLEVPVGGAFEQEQSGLTQEHEEVYR